MKQVAQNYKSGELAVLDVPVPAVPAGRGARAIGVLTDLHGHRADEGVRGQALAARQGAGPARPGEEGRRHRGPAGPAAAYQEGDEPARLLHAARLLAVRRVVEVGAGAEEFAVGQLVACAGNEYALHAEVNWVPANLCVPVPEGVDPRTPRSRRSAPSRCTACAAPSCSWARPPASSGSGSSASCVVQLLVPRVSGSSGWTPSPSAAAWPRRGALVCAAPPEGLALVETGARSPSSRRTRRRPRVPRRRRRLQRARRGRGAAGARPGAGSWTSAR